MVTVSDKYLRKEEDQVRLEREMREREEETFRCRGKGLHHKQVSHDYLFSQAAASISPHILLNAGRPICFSFFHSFGLVV